MRFHWNGQGGQPDWLWGGSNPSDMYVYNPRNFHVSYADSAGNADTLDGWHAADFKRNMCGRNTPTMTQLVDWERMATAAGRDCRDAYNAGSGIRGMNGTISNGSAGTDRPYYCADIIFRQSWRNFDKILVIGSNDDCNYIFHNLFETWDLYFAFTHPSWRIEIFGNPNIYWRVTPYACYGTLHDWDGRYSNDMRWYTVEQNSVLVDIYGINY
jgi:hypothetical protein